MAKKINAPRMAALAALDAMDDLFDPLTAPQKVEAMEEMIDELESRIRCEEGMGEVIERLNSAPPAAKEPRRKER